MKNWNKKILTLFICMLCMMTICMAGCSEKQGNNNLVELETTNNSENTEVTILGEGATIFDFTVVDKEGVETVFEIHTDKELVGEALLDLDLIAGEEGAYGLYVKSVNGIVADYDVDSTYWAFYVNGEYATSGVDATIISEDESYMFKVEK